MNGMKLSLSMPEAIIVQAALYEQLHVLRAMDASDEVSRDRQERLLRMTNAVIHRLEPSVTAAIQTSTL